MPVQITSFGTVEPYNAAAIKSQVTGFLEKFHFVEGQEVKAGDLIISIDPRSYQASLRVAQANLEKDQAQCQNAIINAGRQNQLFKKGFASQDDNDTARTLSNTAKAAVEADKAAVENARLQLEYCSITSPVDGRIGSLLVEQGNLVKANDITIVTVNQIHPIYVTFSVPQNYLPAIREQMQKAPLEVVAVIPAQSANPAHGTLTFVDNTVNADTGSIRLRATFDNNDRRLWPGQFVNTALVLSRDPNALVIPSSAVQNSQQGQFVFVVKPDLSVESRPVTVDRLIDGLTVIGKGLEPDETIVTDGQLRLIAGARVNIINAPQTAAAK